ncbi:hypothetical protein AGRO_5190 [Agrobacterium sp. ATCC 31749]|nr:hypothetical protein AGRO_5190 [Agrobacterium sp. ATCC 31749]
MPSDMTEIHGTVVSSFHHEKRPDAIRPFSGAALGDAGSTLN